MKEIALSQGKLTLVDDEDYNWLSKWKWYAARRKHTWYAVRFVGKRVILMHREILHTPESMQVDHINHDGLLNIKTNLRNCSVGQNHVNSSIITGLSRYKGVTFDKRRGKWQSRAKFNKNHFTLGYFSEEEEAAKAYNIAAEMLFGEFAILNPVEKGGKELENQVISRINWHTKLKRQRDVRYGQELTNLIRQYMEE